MRLSLLLILLSFFFANSQTIDHIQFDYDPAGNQIKRYAIDITPKNSETPIENENLTENDLKETDIYSDIKYYPNPVREQLYVTWINTSKNYVSSIELYSMSGQLMKQYKNFRGKDNTSIEFQSYPEGMYNLILVYSSGEKKTLKIIKR